MIESARLLRSGLGQFWIDTLPARALSLSLSLFLFTATHSEAARIGTNMINTTPYPARHRASSFGLPLPPLPSRSICFPASPLARARRVDAISP